MGKRDKDEHGLAEDLVSLVLRHELDCAAVVKTVRELDEDYAHVIIQCQEDSLEVFRLHALDLCLIFVVEHGLDLCKTFNKGCYFVAEEVCKIFDCIFCIFNNVMKESRND